MAYSEDQKTKIVNDVCARVAAGEAVRNVLKESEFPDAVTFYKWLDADPEKVKQYARATEERSEGIFEEMLNIADTPVDGVTTKTTEKGVEVTTGDMIQHRRLQVETRKWMLGKMNPRKYGDKQQIEHSQSKEQPLFPDVEV